jgi:hypothetical protein
MRRVPALLLLAAGILLLASDAAFAQATIAGVVKDPSGAVLPGVTVEAASPSLIERVRTRRSPTLPAGSKVSAQFDF